MPDCPYNTDGLPQIRAGAAQTVITPPVGTSLAGYFQDRVSESVRDDLHCRALVLEASGEKIVLVSCDLISIPRDIALPAKERIQKQTNIAPDNVLICATHTHTGPETRIGRVVPANTDYLATLPRLIADTVAAADADMFEALLFTGREEEHQLGTIRLGRKTDGSEVFGKTHVIGPARDIDPEVLAVIVRDMRGRVRAVLVNYANHVDVIGGGGAKFLSADWPGEMAKAVAGVYGPDVVTLLLNGACGDINHHYWRPTRHPTGGPVKAQQIGRAIAGLAVSAGEKAEPLDTASCGALLKVVDIPHYTRDQAMRREVDALRARHDLSAAESYVVKAFDEWDLDDKMAPLALQVLRLGDLVFVGLPGEIFTDWGKEIKRWSPAGFTFIAELANDWFGYIPTTDQARRGAYGAKPILSRRLDADGGRQMADAVQVMLYELWSATGESGQ